MLPSHDSSVITEGRPREIREEVNMKKMKMTVSLPSTWKQSGVYVLNNGLLIVHSETKWHGTVAPWKCMKGRVVGTHIFI
jgi:hypothetical protein